MKEIYLKVCNGLGNRLRSISSFYGFAEKTSKKLNICWPTGPGWSEEEFYDLFSSPKLNFISEKEYEVASSNFENLDKLVTKNADASNYVYNCNLKEIIYLILNDSFCYSGDSCLSYMFPAIFKEDFDFLKQLVPCQKIQDKIDQIYKKFNKNTVGVHIRRGDAVTSQFKHNYLLSSVASFEKYMNQELANDKDVKFYLSTDCPSTQFELKNKFPVIFNENKKFVSASYFSPKDNQADALIDMFLLSKTKKILGTNWSSFSGLSSKINETSLVYVKEENNPKIDFNQDEYLIVELDSYECFYDAISTLADSYLESLKLKKNLIIKWNKLSSDKFFENYYINNLNCFLYQEEIPSFFSHCQKFKNLNFEPYRIEFFRKIRPYKGKINNFLTTIIKKYNVEKHDEFLLSYVFEEQNKIQKEKEGFNLVYKISSSNNTSRDLEFLYCLKRNLENKFIKSIHVFINEDSNIITDFLNVCFDENLKIINAKNNLNFDLILSYCNEKIRGKTIIAKPDLVFDEKISQINLKENTFISLKEKSKTNCFIFNSPIFNFDNSSIENNFYYKIKYKKPKEVYALSESD